MPMIFTPVSPDAVTKATERSETLYTLQCNLKTASRGLPMNVRKPVATSSMLSDCLTAMTLTSKPQAQFYTAMETPQVLSGMIAAAQQVTQARPKLAELKVTFNLGTQFLYAGRGMQSPVSYGDMSIDKMNTIQLGGPEATMKSVYSNAVKPACFSTVKQHAVSQLSFTRLATKTTASVHLKNKDLNTSLVVAFIRSGDKLSLRKVKSGAVKPFFLTFLHQHPSQDVRLKLTGQHQVAQDGPEIGSLANIIAGSSMHAGRLHIPCSSTQEVDKARIKTKEVYEGTWKGKVIRIAFNIIQETSGQQHCEVTGRMPGLNSALEAALSDGADLAQLMAEATSDLQVLADFCKELATST